MKKIFTLILFSMIALNAIHAEITWDLADDGTLTISGTDMPDYNGFAPWGSKVEKIKKIVINNGVTNIGSYAFDGCTNLTSITIPNSVTSIGSVAFYGCTSLSSITIPNSVTSIGDMAFYGTKWYDKQPDGLIYAGLVLYKYKGTMPTNTNIVVKQGTNSIGYEAFYNCSGLTSITIPNSVTSIGGSAFSGCYILADKFVNNSICNCNYNVIDVEQKDGLLIKEKEVVRCRPWAVSVTIPNSVTSIGGAAFSGCSGLISIIVEKNNPKYDSRNDCNAIIETQSNTLIVGCKNTVIPNSVTSIGGQAFSGCSDLTSITIPNSVTSIGERAFYYCSGLTAITIPNSVTSIGGKAFEGCSGLTAITIPNSVTSIGECAFYYCSGLTAITIPNSVTSIGSLAFDNTKWYDNQPDGLVYAGLVLYKYKGTMPENTKINLKEGIKGIADSAFKGCLGLTSITIPNSVTRIGNSAFYNCSGITSIEIPNSVTSIGEGVLGGCSGLTSIIVEKANSKFDNRNNCNAIIETQSNSLIAGCMNTVIPNSIRSIGGGAFSGCTGLTSVDIPSSVTSVGASAFRNCTGLTSITIPNSVTSIGIYAFAYCI